MYIDCSDGGGTSDDSLRSTVDDGCSNGGSTICGVTSSVDEFGESSR